MINNPVGGIRTYLRYVYGQPCFQDFRFTLIAPDVNFSEYLKETGLSDIIEFVNVENSHLAFLKTIRRLLRTKHFDLIHSHGFKSGVICEVAKTGKNIRHLMTTHDVFLPKQFQGHKGIIKKQFLQLIFKRITCINPVSEDAKNNLLEHFKYIDPEKVYAIHNGIDVENYEKARPFDMHGFTGIDKNRYLIGFFGRFMAQKGFRDLVDAIEMLVKKDQLNPMPMVLTFGWGGFIREDYQYITEKNLREYFVQLPHTDDVPAALKSVDMVAMPSLWEACSLLAMEALTAGTPLIATNCIGLREILKDTPAKIVPPQNPKALAQAIEAFVASPPKKEFQLFAEQARQRFSVKHSAVELHNLYITIKIHS